MFRELLLAVVLVGIGSTLTLSGQSPTDSKSRVLPDFDIRDRLSSAEKNTTEQLQSGATVERRKANLESFITSPQEVKLGTRIVPTEYGLPKVYVRQGSSLSEPSPGKPAEIAKNFLMAQPEIFLLGRLEVEHLRLLVEDVGERAVFLTFNQTIDGIDVFNGQIKFTLNRDGEVIQVGTGDVVPGLTLSTTPRLSPKEAVEATFAAIGLDGAGALSRVPDTTGKVAFSNPRGGTYSPITAELSIFPMAASSARLAYRIFLEVDAQSWYEMLIDADTGALLFRHNLYAFSGQARVWTESPTVGVRGLVAFPPPSSSAPAGWLPPNGTVTTGNNTDTYTDIDADDRPDTSNEPGLQNGRASGPDQLFDFLFGDGLTQLNPRAYQAAAVTNLFYFVNIAHDYFYGLGFNEVAGNFQTDNFGRGGSGSDAVLAEAQFGGFANNANFSVTPDGTAPRIRMGLFNRGTSALTDDLDSAYDGQVVIHEYGHGVSNRLVGARTSTSCLNNMQSSAMGEGWSDYFGISFFNNPIAAAYVTQNSTRGIRRHSYAGYEFTYEDIGNSGYEVHNDGEIWAGALWDLRTSLGSAVTDSLVINGLKSTPCNPAMTDARDAILSADQATNLGVNRAAIWAAFARHGLGYSAKGVDGNLATGTRYDAAYDLPLDLQVNRNPSITSNPLSLRPGAGDFYRYNLVAANPEGSVLNYALSKGPEGMTVDSTNGFVNWTATFTTPRVKITVTDSRGGKVVHGYSLPVSTLLTDRTPITIAGERSSVGFARITVPANVPVLQVTLRNGSGDSDLWVKDPTGIYSASLRVESTETLSFANPRAGEWEIEVDGYSLYSGVSLAATTITPALLSSNTVVAGLGGVVSSETFYRITIPVGASAFSISTNAGTGDVDMFLRKGSPAVCQPSNSVFADCLWTRYSVNTGNSETVSMTNPDAGDWYLSLVAGRLQYADVTLAVVTTFPALTLASGGSATISTPGTAAAITAGYATALVNSGTVTAATAVFGFSQNGYIVSEAGIPASPPSQSARIFIDYRTGVAAGIGTLQISTGIAIANRTALAAALTYTLRDRNGQTVAVGHGTLPAGAHRSKFVHELRDIAPDFIMPVNFSTATLYGSLEIAATQPVSVLALRLTTNQRGEALLTSTVLADLSRPLTTSPVYFPQLANGGGYTTSVILLNTSSATQAGTISIFDDAGNPLSMRAAGGTTGSTFPYSISASGMFVFQTDGGPASVSAGWAKVTPSPGNTAPVGAGVLSYSPEGILITESGVPSAVPTTRARIYLDKSRGHDTALAIANPGTVGGSVALRAFQTNGTTPAGNGQATLNLAANGHTAAFIGQVIGGLPVGFTGVAELTSTSPFVALTLRSLTNGRGDFLLTTFPIAVETQTTTSPIVFPQFADGGGYTTQFIFISATGEASVSVSFVGDNGLPLNIGRTQ